MRQYEEMASALRDAYSGDIIPPLRPELDPTDVDGAYAVQAINTDFWTANGRTISGRKIGLTSKAVQQQLGVDQPDFGVLFDDMRVLTGEIVEANRLIQPKAEAEIAIVLGKDILDPDCTPEAFAAAADHAVAAIEVVDSRIQDWQITFADTVADNGSSALYVLGEQKQCLEDLDLYTCGMVLEVDGKVASIGAGAACLGHPLNAGAWLVRTLSAHGIGLNAGEVILTGALGPMVTLQPGQTIPARIGGIGACQFSLSEG